MQPLSPLERVIEYIEERLKEDIGLIDVSREELDDREDFEVYEREVLSLDDPQQ